MSLLEEEGENNEKARGQSIGKGIRESLPSGWPIDKGRGHCRDWMMALPWEVGRVDVTCPFLQGGGDRGSERLTDVPKVIKPIRRATVKTPILCLLKNIVFLPAICPVFVYFLRGGESPEFESKAGKMVAPRL